MKSIAKLITLILPLLCLTSCIESYSTSENNIDCALTFEEHGNHDAFQTLLNTYATDGFVGMTLLIDDPDEGLWIGSSGYANIEEDIKMNPCHEHHTASLYKTFISTVILQLVQEEKLHLDDKLNEYLEVGLTERIPNANMISIRNLLEHRTGIPDIFEVEFITDFFNHPELAYSMNELIEYVYDKEALSEPGTDFYYSDANYTLLTLLIEAVEGSHTQAIRDRIFSPLNLTDTYFIEDPSQVPERLAESYWDRYGNGEIENNSDVQIALTAGLKGSDGIISTANDLKIFIKALSDATLLNDISEMTTFRAVGTEIQQNNVYSGYGLGLMQVSISAEEWYGHFGNQIGSGAILLYNAERDITLVALQNTGTFFSDDIKGKFFYELLSDVESILF